MKHFNLHIFVLLLAALAACDSHDDFAPSAPEASVSEGERFMLEIPVCWAPGHGGTTRLGDPGLKEDCPEPANLYLFTWIRSFHKPASPEDDKYELYFVKREGLTAADWQLRKENTTSERYELRNTIKFDITAPTMDGYTDGDLLGRTFAIASGRTLSTAQLEAILGNDYKSVLATPETAVEFNHTLGSAIDATLQEAVVSLDAWAQTDYRDLYSTPMGSDGREGEFYNMPNAQILYSRTLFPGAGVGHGAVRLYHVAAKIDFQWEVSTTLQSTTAIERITVEGLPSRCRIFRPANNPATDAATNPALTYVLDKDNADGKAITPGNKWIGRLYFYHLQPSDATIRYGVTFEDVDGDGTVRTPVSGATFAPSLISPVFAGWYRIPATVN